MAETQPSQSITKTDTTVSSSISETEMYKRQRRQQLLAQCKDIIDLRADVDRRKLSLIINHAVASAFE